MKEDKRIAATKHILKSTLVELLKAMALEEITVKYLCDEAEINRSTFYRHYPTVNALYDDLRESFYHDLISNMERIYKADSESLYGIFVKTLQYIEENRETCIIIFHKCFYPGFETEFSRLYRKQWDLPDRKGFSSEKNAHLHAFICGGLMNVVWSWLQSTSPTSIEETAKMLTEFVSYSFRRLNEQEEY